MREIQHHHDSLESLQQHSGTPANGTWYTVTGIVTTGRLQHGIVRLPSGEDGLVPFKSEFERMAYGTSWSTRLSHTLHHTFGILPSSLHHPPSSLRATILLVEHMCPEPLHPGLHPVPISSRLDEPLGYAASIHSRSKAVLESILGWDTAPKLAHVLTSANGECEAQTTPGLLTILVGNRSMWSVLV